MKCQRRKTYVIWFNCALTEFSVGEWAIQSSHILYSLVDEGETKDYVFNLWSARVSSLLAVSLKQIEQKNKRVPLEWFLNDRLRLSTRLAQIFATSTFFTLQIRAGIHSDWKKLFPRTFWASVEMARLKTLHQHAQPSLRAIISVRANIPTFTLLLCGT